MSNIVLKSFPAVLLALIAAFPVNAQESTDDMMKIANASKSDVDGFTDMVRSISGVEVALMIFQQDNSSCRINFRSKGKYIVNDIANELGGGGHVFAAGALVNGNLNDVSRKVVNITAASVQEKMKGN